MDFKEYQEKAHSTSLNTKAEFHKNVKTIFEMMSVLGYVSEKTKKLYRDKNGIGSDQHYEDTLDSLEELRSVSEVYGIVNPISKELSEKDKETIYPVLGLIGEVGETVEKINMVMVNPNPKYREEFKKELTKELGDLTWYISEIATKFDLSLEDIAQENIKKLFSRKERGQIKGNGDNR